MIKTGVSDLNPVSVDESFCALYSGIYSIAVAVPLTFKKVINDQFLLSEAGLRRLVFWGNQNPIWNV
ncbi:hypothetical protein ACT048_20485 [Ectopseudomonas khazarica]|uniref:hypothetical protein n=1 Tax=Ectopseudomonas khazarica TaxID=2502979 RepID=UPI004034B824